MRTIAIVALVLSLMHSTTFAQQQQTANAAGAGQSIPPEASYGLGYDVGREFARAGITPADVSSANFMKGLVDALGMKQPTLDQNVVTQAMQKLQQVLQQRRSAKQQQFLEANKKKDGVVETESGLQYEVLKSGTGATPTTQSRVTVHYEGKLFDGQIFDSSLQRATPATFPVTGVIKGWTEALLRMKVGDKWRLVIPPELAYGADGSPPAIGPNEALIFEVELLSVQ